jgi:hypothetical protein
MAAGVEVRLLGGRMSKPEVVADNEVPGPEPEGFWEPIHKQVERLAKLGRDEAPGSPRQTD